MGRRASVRYWDSRQAYCCEYKGRQHILAVGPKDEPNGPTYTAAVKAWVNLTLGDDAARNRDATPVKALVKLYLDHAKATTTPGTYRIRCQGLHPFADRFGNTSSWRLLPFEVNAWVNEMRQPRQWTRSYSTGKTITRMIKWGDGQARNALKSILAMLNWAVAEKILTKNPLKGIKLPKERKRSRKAVMSLSQWKQIQDVVTGDWLDFCMILWHTGARPSEIAAVTADDLTWNPPAIIYHGDNDPDSYTHKTAKQGKDRVILLTGEALTIIQRKVQQHPTGLLFGAKPREGDKGQKSQLRRWTDQRIAGQFAYISKQVGFHVTAYHFRHTFITNWIQDGQPVEMLAEMVGNSPEIIYKHYTHLFSRPQPIWDRLLAFNNKRLLPTHDWKMVYPRTIPDDQGANPSTAASP